MPSTGNYIGKQIPSGYLTRSQLAALAGCHPDTVVRWEMRGGLTPAALQENGSTRVRLYRKDQPCVVKFLTAMKKVKG